MAIEPDGMAPYAPAQTVIELLEGYRNRGFATPFRPEVLQKAGVPDSLINRTLQAFRLFDLIDKDGNPSEQFTALKQARGEEEYKSRLGSWLTNVYAEVLRYADPATDDVKKVSEAFRGYKPEGQRSRMVSLMIGLFAYAGLIPEPAKRAAPVKQKREPAKSGGRASGHGQNSGDGRRGGKSGDGRSSGQVDVPSSVAGLLGDLPQGKKRWTVEQRDAWWKTFEVVLNYAYPTNEDVHEQDDEAADDEE